MPGVIAYNGREACVFVQSTAALLIDEMCRAQKDVVRLLEQHDTEHVFWDVSEVVSLPPTVILYEFGSRFVDVGFPLAARIAIVGREPILGEFEFLETVVRNRGMAMRRFVDRDAALAWLRRKSRGHCSSE